MSGKRMKRERRRAGVVAMREQWSDPEFGLQIDSYANGRTRVTWSVDREPSMALLGLGRLRSLVNELEEELVLSLRMDGESWDEIGWLLDRTGEAVRRRYAAAESAYRAALPGESA